MLIVLYYFHLAFYNKNFIRPLFFQQVFLKSDTRDPLDKIIFHQQKEEALFSLLSSAHEFTVEFAKFI